MQYTHKIYCNPTDIIIIYTFKAFSSCKVLNKIFIKYINLLFILLLVDIYLFADCLFVGCFWSAFPGSPVKASPLGQRSVSKMYCAHLSVINIVNNNDVYNYLQLHLIRFSPIVLLLFHQYRPNMMSI